ncbi:MAG: TrkH family potassium uptake protein [Bacteroidales bacterium]|nr:TrkH family potassium uptake protein [Bacteroidales bacterium]
MINYKIIFNILGKLLVIEGIFMLLSVLFSIYYNESDFYPILLSSAITLLSGAIVWFITKNPIKKFGKREGYIIVSLVWIVFSFFGSLPFVFSGAITNYTDAFFETISGFTTTGASILNDIEALPHGILFWRSLTQWMGGMGIIVLSIAILPLLGIGGMQLFAAEVPGLTPDKLHPKIKETAKRLWIIYFMLTLTEAILLILGNMDFFDAICHSLTTMATGGYSTKQASVAYWSSSYIHYVIIAFMFLAGTNFTLSYFALKFKFSKIIHNEEFRFYIGFIIIFSAIISIVLFIVHKQDFNIAIRDSLFQVVSIMTTTGFVTVDYLRWVPFLGVIILFLMFLGGSAGSTGGSIKIVRIVLILKNSYFELKRLIHPNAIIPVRLNNKVVSESIIMNVLAFIFFYILIFIFGVIIMSSMGLDLDSSLGAVAATLGNIGPGIGSVGPVENFYHIPAFGKWFLSFLMLTGRLEIFTVLILFSPTFWKR